LFSTETFGAASFPPWRVTQPARDESKLVVKYRGRGVEVGSSVGVGAGVSEAGIGVGEAGIVAVGGMVGPGVGVAVWQDVVKTRHPIKRSFFMLHLL